MRVVPDTNLIIKGLLFRGDGREIINLAYSKKIELFGSQNSFDEIKRVVYYENFKKYLEKEIYSPEKLLLAYKLLINIRTLNPKYRNLKIVKDDEDDDEFIRIAKTVGAKIIISSDKHLKKLEKIDDIRIVEPHIFLEIYPSISGKTFF